MVTSSTMGTRSPKEALRGLATHDGEFIQQLLNMQLDNIQNSGLDPRTHAMTRLGALIALDAPPASFAWQISIGMQSGLTPDDVVGAMIAVAPSVGMAKIVAAAPEIAFALQLNLEDEDEEDTQ